MALLPPGDAKWLLIVQDTRCTTPTFASLERCLACATRRVGEHCRFRKNRLCAVHRDTGAVRCLGGFAKGSGFRLSRHPAVEGGGSVISAQEHQDATYVLRHICRPFVDALLEERSLLPDGARIVVAASQMASASADPAKEARVAMEHITPGEKQLCDWCNTTIM
jgi:hypothetical protein